MTDDVAGELLPEYLLGTLDPERAVEVEAALARSPALRREAEALSDVLFALPEALEPEALPDRAWTDLRTALAADVASGDPSQAGAGSMYDASGTYGTNAMDVAAPGDAPDAVEGTAGAAGGVGSGTAPGDGSGAARRTAVPVRAPRRRVPGTFLALAASLVLLIGAGVWGYQGAREQARLATEQRIIAYWMRNPNLEIVSLDGVGPGALAAGREQPEVPPGVVCVLPDGRAMLLQPYAPPRGSRYVLYGITDGGPVELGATDGRFLLFEAGTLRGVEVALDGRRDAVVAQARF